MLRRLPAITLCMEERPTLKRARLCSIRQRGAWRSAASGLALLLLTSASRAYAGGSIIDFGMISDSSFSTRSQLPSISGLFGDVVLLTNGQVAESFLELIYVKAVSDALPYITERLGDVAVPCKKWPLRIRVVSVADLNNPTNFSDGEAACMKGRNSKRCDAYRVGAFTWRADWNYVSIYVAADEGIGTLREAMAHELMHAVLYSCGVQLRDAAEERFASGFGRVMKKK